MKLLRSKAARNAASALVTTLVICSIMSLSVMYYLSLVEQQTLLSMRAQSWNIAIAITEAGVEEALQHLNSNQDNLGSDGWSSQNGVYTRSNSLPDGNSYVVFISMTNASLPVIVSRAHVQPPRFAQGWTGLAFAAAGVTPPGPTTVTRAVRVTCSKTGLFNAALVAKRSIDLKGNGVLTDSYDSSDPAKSTSGRYDPNKYAGDRGDVATNGGIESSVSVQNANIYGKLHTGPNCPVSVGSNGGVGTHAWQAANHGLQPGYVLEDANFTFPDTAMPNTTGYLTPLSGSVVEAIYNVTSKSTNSATFPQPPPAGGVGTNVLASVTSSTLPQPIPPGTITNSTPVTTSLYPGHTPGLTTNVVMVNNSPTLPNPVPAGSSTNSHAVSNQKDPPAAGHYVPGTLVQNPNKNKWSWMAIDSYNFPTLTYTFPSISYTYPTAWSYTFSVSQTNVTYQTNYYDNILEADGKYVCSALTGATLVRGPNVKLALPNGLTGNEKITFSQGAQLTVHAGGTSISVTGNNVINPNGYAGSLIILCTSSVTQIKFAGNGEFTGVIVAPEADLELKGGGSGDQDFCGTLMVNTVRMNGHFSFHYDEALSGITGNGRWLVTSWDEIP